MRKTKLNRIIIHILTAVLLLTAFPVSVAAANQTYQTKDVTAYLYSMDSKTKLECMFNDDLSSVPYVDAADYLNQIFTVSFTESKGDDGVYSVTSKNGTMTVDPQKDTVSFDAYEEFTSRNVNSKNSAIESDYLNEAGGSYITKPSKVTLELSPYKIDLVELSGKVYFPLYTINDLFAGTYNAAEYVDGKLYFVHTMDSETDGYFDRSSLYESDNRDKSMIDYTYNELCFAVDNLYGMPSKSQIAENIRTNGLDKTLDSFSDQTKEAKELLMSDSLTDFYLGLTYLSVPFDDGGHTVFVFEPLAESEKYADTAFFHAWNELQEGDSEKAQAFQSITTEMQSGSMMAQMTVSEARDKAYSAYDKVKSWGSTARFIVHGDTGVFIFDSFTDEAVEPFKWSLDYAADNGVDNFVIDLSMNTGGNSNVLQYMAAIMTNKENHTNKNSLQTLCTLTGSKYQNEVELDLNLDGKFDEKDSEMVYDFHFAVLTTKCSFSCGNLLPVIAKDNHIPVIGKTSGGGSSMLTKFYMPGSHYYAMSGPEKYISNDGTDADLGAEPDYDLTTENADGLTDYTTLYDIEQISAKVHEYYGEEPNNAAVASAKKDASADSSPADSDQTGFPVWAIVCTAAAAVFLLVAIVLIIKIRNRKKNRDEQNEHTSSSN